MQKFYIQPTKTTPEISFSAPENIFIIKGISAPEDVRAMYYPVIEWIKNYINEFLEEPVKNHALTSPLILKIDLAYFNSSSAKFLYDIIMELKKLTPFGKTFIIEWFYNKEDIDHKEAGADIASLVDMEFSYVSK